MNWVMIEYLTAPDMMSVLRQMTLILFITINGLHCVNKSALFADNRQVDAQFAFVTEENCRAIELSEEIPNGSRFRPRETVRVTYTIRWLNRKYEHMTNLDCYYNCHQETFHVWYTSRWTFGEVFTLDDAFGYITKIETIVPLRYNSTTIYPLQLRTLAMS
ncbi:unnamed protein product [Adineta ricciae]|uniref:Uncharacterized protein n=1 Tax=Adineta ricciae TaxID=249248 RepID=A0A815NLM3_ADIRI|nr:unnamed protein product [Adineta ricciae]CAF1613258.1 unnamed protein product [Adineta ricciae]